MTPGSQTQSDGLTEILFAVSTGDADAFRTLYDRTSPKLFGIVLRMMKDRAAAHDVLQDVFLRVWQKAGTYNREHGQPMTWLIAIARYTAIDALRKPAAQPLPPGHDDAGSHSGHDDPHAARPGEDVFERDRLHACLLTLDDDQRRCVLLAYCSGYSREELARVVDRPIGTIKTWLQRSLRVLRACLERA